MVQHSLRRSVGLTASVLFASCGTNAPEAERTSHLRLGHQSLPWRVLYAHNGAIREGATQVPASEHTKEMLRFLGSRVQSVRAVPLAWMTRADLAACDVVLVDGDFYDKDASGRILRRAEVTAPAFELLDGKPTVLMGGVGGRIGDLLLVKTSWVSG